jgi:ubiquinone biosynthesis protein
MEAALSNLLVVSTMVVMVLAFATVIRRLLGVRVGVVRTMLAALLAVLVAGQLLRALVPEPAQTDQGTLLLMLLLAVSCASLLAMIVLVLAEVLLPDGSLPGPIELWRGWRTRLARTRRYWQVLRLAMRHGLGRFLRGRHHIADESPTARRQLARSVRRALEDGGVTFVKLGQQLSTRPDLITPEFAEELERLQDRAASVPWDDIATVLRSELHSPVEEAFAGIDRTPVAAASVAQVHAARLLDGTEVVVKVQRPGIASVVDRDLDILHRLARMLETRTRWAQALGVRDLATGFADALREELDFRIEFENLNAMAATLAASPRNGVRVPTTYAGMCTERVLVMEKLPGRPLSTADDLLDALSAEQRRHLATSLLETMMAQVLDSGLFHVDIHPGNVLVADDGSLGMLDLGSVGRLDATTRTALGQLIAAIGRSDSLAASDALLELVDRPEQIDERSLERAMGVLIVRYASSGAALSPAAFGALMRLVTAHRLAIPPQVAAVFRAFATLEATLTIIDPGLDLMAEARNIGNRQMAEAMMPNRLRRAAEEDMVALLPMLRRLPRRFDRVADAVEHGRVSMNVRLFADVRDRRVVTDLLHQTLLTILGASAGVMAVMLLGIPDGPRLTPSIELYAMFGYGLLVVAVVLVLRVLIVIFRHDPVN